jgi:hypothetical protein
VEADSEQIKAAGRSGESFRDHLERAWDIGFVADITLVDGTEFPAVLIAVSSTALVLDHWDVSLRAPAGDPFTLAMRSIAEVVVP